MGETAQIVAWTGAICTGIGGLAGGLATAFVMIRKANAEVEMGERKQEDGVAAEAYSLFKEAMTARVVALEKALEIVTDKLERSREAHAKCEIETANLKGDMRVMQLEISALKRHEKVQAEHVNNINEGIRKIDPTAVLPVPPIEPISK
jgi:hypothetical protein